MHGRAATLRGTRLLTKRPDMSRSLHTVRLTSHTSRLLIPRSLLGESFLYYAPLWIDFVDSSVVSAPCESIVGGRDRFLGFKALSVQFVRAGFVGCFRMIKVMTMRE